MIIAKNNRYEKMKSFRGCGGRGHEATRAHRTPCQAMPPARSRGHDLPEASLNQADLDVFGKAILLTP